MEKFISRCYKEFETCTTIHVTNMWTDQTEELLQWLDEGAPMWITVKPQSFVSVQLYTLLLLLEVEFEL